MTAEISESLTRYPFHDAKLMIFRSQLPRTSWFAPDAGPGAATNESFRTEWVLLFASYPQRTLRELLKEAGYR